MFGKKEVDVTKVNTVIGPGTKLDGLLESSASIRIDGQFNGEIKTDGNVTIGKDGTIHADIHAENVTLDGHVQGNLFVRQHLFLAASSHVDGDIEAASFEMEQGAVFNGKSIMKKMAQQDTQQESPAPPKNDSTQEGGKEPKQNNEKEQKKNKMGAKKS